MSMMPDIHHPGKQKPLARRHNIDTWFVNFCRAIAFTSIVILAVLLMAILAQAIPTFDLGFLTRPPSSTPSEAGIYPALFGSLWICGVCGLFALPIGVATAIFLEEFKPRSVIARYFHSFVQLNISNLAGVPSVVYGIVGYTAFASMFYVFGEVQKDTAEYEIGIQHFDQFFTEGERLLRVPVDHGKAPPTEVVEGLKGFNTSGELVEITAVKRGEGLPQGDARLYALRTNAKPSRASRKSWYYLRLPFGRCVVAGGLTLMLVVLPIVITASQESLRAVPDSLREASLGMGATRWQTVRNVTLPSATPGIMTGSILGMSRAMGEAAPILIICGIIYISSPPQNLMDEFMVMPLQIFYWAKQPKEEYHILAAQGIVVLLTVLLSINAVAVWIRSRTQTQN